MKLVPDITIFFQWALFLTLLLLLNRLLFKPLLDLFERRAKAHEEPERQAQVKAAEAEALQSQVQGRLVALRQQADGLQAQMTKEASEGALTLTAKARGEAEQITEQSRAKIAAAEGQARQGMEAQAHSLAERIVARILEGNA